MVRVRTGILLEFEDDGGSDLIPLRQIAERLGVPFAQVASVIGIGWTPIDIGDEESKARWYFCGQPPQVLVRVGGWQVLVARPRVQWLDPGRSVPATTEPVTVELSEPGALERLGSEVDRQATLERRRAFYCPNCRSFSAPDFGAFADNDFGGCGCSFRVGGIVY